MKSRIPKSKSEKRRNRQFTESPTPSTGPEIQDDRAARIQSSLQALGAPHLSQEEFSSVFTGPFADILLFINEHMKGRQGVARLRGQIHSMREERKKSNIRRPDDALRSVADKAASVLSAARKTTERKRKILMMLQVLEKRESLRVKRFEELGRLLVDLRTAMQDSKSPVRQTANLPTTNAPLSDGFRLNITRTRTSHTRETLANWQAYHIRLSRLIQDRNNRQAETELVHRLKEAVSKRQPGSDADATIEDLGAVARTRAKRKTRYRSQLASQPVITKTDLQYIEEGNKAKVQQIQLQLDKSNALTFVSEHHIRVISTFMETTSHIIRSSLEEKGAKKDGLVDQLMGLICALPAAEDDHCEQFALSVRETVGMRGNFRLKGSSENVSFPSCNYVAKAEMADEDSYHADAKKSQERASKLLTRKVEKAEMGLSLVQDIEDLMRETRTILIPPVYNLYNANPIQRLPSLARHRSLRMNTILVEYVEAYTSLLRSNLTHLSQKGRPMDHNVEKSLSDQLDKFVELFKILQKFFSMARSAGSYILPPGGDLSAAFKRLYVLQPFA
ncbi:uncharacterized protein LACBIDRAFT_325881 [Laccaria bicolor S238N-H82]|uniref:Predicted protein n=1 Tax=Laccaria bicolor (strain S238N-H82 / ATCC MYA-4686) TaxID=486041 RepID=B0D6K0_LACBS|nr:uncharacterized protein LACBIDRAFT_325881 [Laccaria bicolor S238N-H82]EDR10199.1 predicted protein [Laccaria bicolor S238N-H82]|eukprot:XP_001879584.1 predicted protein [Laccaria bicolor S238N-H82]